MREVERPNQRGLTVEAWSAWSLGGYHREREREETKMELEAVTERERGGGNGKCLVRREI